MRRSTQGPKSPFSHDLHVLSTPPAFNLSQDQTLQFKSFAKTQSALPHLRHGLQKSPDSLFNCQRSRPVISGPPFWAEEESNSSPRLRQHLSENFGSAPDRGRFRFPAAQKRRYRRTPPPCQHQSAFFSSGPSPAPGNVRPRLLIILQSLS